MNKEAQPYLIMNKEAFLEAVSAVGDTVRLYTKSAANGVSIMAAALAFDACNSKDDSCSWEELDKIVLDTVKRSLEVSRQTLTRHAPHG